MAAPERDAGPLLLWRTMNDWRPSVIPPDYLRGSAVLLVALSLIAFPVSYAGGNDAAHPHAMVQLVIESAHGALNHHAPRNKSHHEEPINRPVRLDAVPDGANIVSLPSGFAQRFALLGIVIGFGLTVLLLFLVLAASAAERRDGVPPRPTVPPPRRVI